MFQASTVQWIPKTMSKMSDILHQVWRSFQISLGHISTNVWIITCTYLLDKIKLHILTTKMHGFRRVKNYSFSKRSMTNFDLFAFSTIARSKIMVTTPLSNETQYYSWNFYWFCCKEQSNRRRGWILPNRGGNFIIWP